ncbi:hypothetical protein AV521_36705 [Streptomyces sp. IMTB 2501]|uniref:hypothetical protein n=1 Tax=Streptomyces sp. IMTB 2501 TaxID=1776340 RepID=UPI00096C79AD|nr:hypothetical protein [Streptomyces sp. IMTB 2501]OLZ64080.1 hypothetical protein AV521_36705 [Streptomyces sp. IMTB 2501]
MPLGQPPGGEQNPHSQNPYQQPRRPQPSSGGGGGNRAKVVAIAAVTTVVVAVGVTGSLLLGGGKDDSADGRGGNAKASASASPSASASASASGHPQAGGTERPAVPGWKVVVNPEWGTAFDVPPDWDVKKPSMLIGFDDSKVDYNDPHNWGKAVIVMSGSAILQENWCVSVDDRDGLASSTWLAGAGTKGAKGARSTGDAALSQVERWVYGGYTQPDEKSIVSDRTATPYTTKSGIRGSIAWARSRNTPQKGKCASDGKAITFGFKNSAGGLVAWTLFCATGVRDELPDSTIMKILSTVRLHGKPKTS